MARADTHLTFKITYKRTFFVKKKNRASFAPDNIML